MKKREQLIKDKGYEEGIKEYCQDFANNQQKYRDNEKDTEEKSKAYKKEQAEYMKQFRAKKKLEKGRQEKGENTLICAWTAHKARKEQLQLRAQDQSKDINPTKRPGGRPKKPRNPAGRPKKQQ